MRVTDLLLAVVLACLAIIAGLALLPPLSPPRVHAEYATMLSAGGHPPLGWIMLGGGFAILIVAAVVALLALGVRRGGTGGRRAMFVGFLVYVSAMVALVVSYAATDENSAWNIGLAFPEPTSWMMFLLWPLPSVFAILWIWKFRAWVWAPEDDTAFEEILAEDRARRSDE